MNSSNPNDANEKSNQPPQAGGTTAAQPLSDPSSSQPKTAVGPPPPSPENPPPSDDKVGKAPSPSDHSTSSGKEAGPSDSSIRPPEYPPAAGQPPPYPPLPAAYDGQYVVGVPPQQIMGPTWSTGIFECFDDIPTFFITFLCPCVTFGQVAEIVDKGRASCAIYAAIYTIIMYFTGCGCLLSAFYRMKMSRQYNLPDDPLVDTLVHLLCEPCALCQEYRELQARGFDMTLGVGWKEQRPEIQQSGGIMMPPRVPDGMNR